MNQPADPLAPHTLSPTELQELLAAERQGGALLVVRDDEGRLAVQPLGGSDHGRTIGRRPEADFAVGWDPEVSGLHAELHLSGGEWAIVDDGLSRNGTYVNGKRIAGRQRLRDGDRIRVGQTVIAFRAGGATSLRETVAARPATVAPRLTESQRRVLVALCRPYRERTGFSAPATNQEIAAELFLSVEAVKMHLRTLFAKFELTDLPQNQKRVRLAESVLEVGVLTERDLA